MASEIPAAVIPPVPGPEPSADIPATDSAIAIEVLARNAAINEKFERLDAAPAPLINFCECVDRRLHRV